MMSNYPNLIGLPPADTCLINHIDAHCKRNIDKAMPSSLQFPLTNSIPANSTKAYQW